MGNALTLTQAAERLAPVFTDSHDPSGVATIGEDGSLTLESASIALAERLNGKPIVTEPRRDVPAATADGPAWSERCASEDAAFERNRPNWTADDRATAAAFLMGLGFDEQQLRQFWQTPQAIDLASPACMSLAQLIVGDHATPIDAALAAVGFSDDEIESAMAGETSVIMRDHRIQELIARAIDADTTRKD